MAIDHNECKLIPHITAATITTLVFAFLIIILTTPIALAESDEYGMINPRIFSQLTHGRSPHNEAHLSMIHAYEAWDLFEQVMSQPNGLSEVANVGIIDTQFYESHGDVRFAKTFANNDEATIRRQYEDSKNTGDSSPSHGTHVAGILGAIHQNNDGIDGMYPLANEPYEEENGTVQTRSHIYAVSMHGHDYLLGNFRDALEEMLRQDVKVINVSMGVLTSKEVSPNAMYRSGYNYSEYTSDDIKSIAECIQAYLDMGHDFVIVTAAGNAKVPAEAGNPLAAIKRELFPEVYDRIIVVGNCTSKKTMAGDSNYGRRVDLVAPGVDVYSTVPDGFSAKSGTSMSAPFVSGTAAMLWCVCPTASGKQIKEWILNNSEKDAVEDKRTGLGEFLNHGLITDFWTWDSSYFDADFGLKYPLLNANEALNEALLHPVDYDYLVDQHDVSYNDMFTKHLETLVAEEGVMDAEWINNWTTEDINGLLSADIRDYNGDGKEEMLTVYFQMLPTDYNGKQSNVLHCVMSLYGITQKQDRVVLNDRIIIPISPFFVPDLGITDQVSCFTVNIGQRWFIVLDSHSNGVDAITSLAILSYNGHSFKYEVGLGFGNYYTMGDLGIYQRNTMPSANEITWFLRAEDAAHTKGWSQYDYIYKVGSSGNLDARRCLSFYDRYVKLLRDKGFTGDDARLPIRWDELEIKIDPNEIQSYIETIDRSHSYSAVDIYLPTSGIRQDIDFICDVQYYSSMHDSDTSEELRRNDYIGLLMPYRKRMSTIPDAETDQTTEQQPQSGDDSDEYFMSLLSPKLKDRDLLAFISDDYDGDGQHEAFALIGVYNDETWENSAELWYVCSDGIVQCEREGGYYPFMSELVNIDSQTCFQVCEGYFGSGSALRMWTVRDGLPVLYSGDYMQEDLNVSSKAVVDLKH